MGNTCSTHQRNDKYTYNILFEKIKEQSQLKGVNANGRKILQELLSFDTTRMA
jgi:hypothetical protein